MAREASQREDSLREATALVERVEISPPDADAVVVGFRPDGAFSVFFGEDPAYHFNAAGELRRAYCGGLLYKATGGQLASLRRERTEHETRLVRHELTPAEQDAFLAALGDRLRMMASQFAAGDFTVTGQVPQDADVLGRVRAWLGEHRDVEVASRPNV
jgi:hypothetical protein